MVVGKVSTMVVGISQPALAGEEIGSKGKRNFEEEEGRNTTNDSSTEEGEGHKRGQRNPSQ